MFKCLNLWLWIGASWWSSPSVLAHPSTVPGSQWEALLLARFVHQLQLLVCEQSPALIWFLWHLQPCCAGRGPVCLWSQSCAAFPCTLVFYVFLCTKMLPCLEHLYKITHKMKVPFQSYLCALIQSFANTMFTFWTRAGAHILHTHIYSLQETLQCTHFKPQASNKVQKWEDASK